MNTINLNSYFHYFLFNGICLMYSRLKQVGLCVFGYFGNGYPKFEIFGYPGTRKQFCKNT